MNTEYEPKPVGLNLAALEAAARAGLEVAEKATKGPWENLEIRDGRFEVFGPTQKDRGRTSVDIPVECFGKGNANFIAASRELVPAQCNAVLALAARVREQDAEIARRVEAAFREGFYASEPNMDWVAALDGFWRDSNARQSLAAREGE